ncbi:hypothetical protein ACIBH1_27025 [Nonomuraea sp. NPDC050663]|uniref:Uncharacterized protein n=1 Tax=Nonomuraea soli TaxID=1032476 RepID=A0A7W0CU87_9ACTN|nr:hypothetical protein [Nonomuraea soli]MBA2897463.1 hypothetical protein [Nonomuraea soli]NUT44712.1 hypothetical protein [Thermoactinospora sp.]
MNAELEYQLIKSHASELQREAARHRRVREAEKSSRSERRSVFGKRRHES